MESFFLRLYGPVLGCISKPGHSFEPDLINNAAEVDLNPDQL